MLANKKAMTSLLRFLQVTNMEVREKARDKKANWEQRNNQAGKNLQGWVKREIPKSCSIWITSGKTKQKEWIKGKQAKLKVIDKRH